MYFAYSYCNIAFFLIISVLYISSTFFCKNPEISFVFAGPGSNGWWLHDATGNYIFDLSLVPTYYSQQFDLKHSEVDRQF